MRTDRSTRRWLCGAALVLLGATGCPGTLHDKARFLDDAAVTPDDAGGCGDVVARIFVPSCGGNGCHGATAPQQGLDLVSAGVAARVVGVAGTGCTALLADPGEPASSLLYTKLLDSPACGSRMPLARLPLSSADTACVLDWIAGQ